MKRGHIELSIDKVVMFGIAGSGKTCALTVMLGDNPPDITSSTPLMKRPVEVLFMDVDKKLHWKIKTLQEVNDSIAEIIRSRMPKQAAEALVDITSPSSPSQQPSHTTADQPIPEVTTTTTSEAARETPTPPKKKPTGTVQSEAEGSLDSVLQSTDMDEEFISLINTSPPSSEPILRLRQILVLDSGGQPHFHELIPVFLNGASDFIYVFKVHESLDIRSMIRYFKEGKLVFQFRASQTNEETLKQCTRAMTSLTAKNKDIPLPRLLFLATHPDMVSEGELPGKLEALHKRLKEILLPQLKDQIVYCNKKGDFIFTMNAAKPVKKDQECAEAIRRCLSKEREGRKGVKVPLRWYALYQKLLKVMESLGKKVLSREQCGLVAESIEVDEESCEEALQFFNRLNMLFYFPDILPNLVFMDPQMLLDKVTELVEESYRLSQAKEDKSLFLIEGEELKFRDHGQVTEKFLSKFDIHYEKPLFTPKELITLLKGLLVFANLSENVYFMPCLLQVKTPEVVAQYQVSGQKALALHFPDSGPLLGMFCSTVAYLLSSKNTHPCPWEVVQDDAGTPKCLNRNVIQFTIPKVTGAISLIDHFTHFEIHICTHPKKAAQLWKMAHDAVFSGLEKARKTLGYANNTPVPAIVCPAHPTVPHPATVEDSVWTCSKMPLVFGDVAEGSIPWWTVYAPHSECRMYTFCVCFN